MAQEEKNPYSATVILPQTEFPMRANLSKREPDQIKEWEEKKVFHKMKEIRSDAPEFVLHDGPPYANGNFHTGHALNKILKDMIVKSKNLSGFRADMIPGWDCHGLPIEVQVLKSLGKKAKETPAEELRQLCRNYAETYVEKQGGDLSRFLCFWEKDRIYLTMSKDYEAKIVEVFGQLFQKGFIYRGKKPVYWCIDLATAHAEAEIEYHPHVSPSIYVKFPVKDKKGLFCLIWTTTPWTLPANLAICFNRKIDYAAFETEEGEKLILAEALREEVENQTGKSLKFAYKVEVSELEKMMFRHPFLDQDSIPLFGDHVTLEAGTGCVHTAPGHGQDDYRVGLEAGLEPYSPVDDYGRYTDEFPLMKGIKVFDANPKIVELLQSKGMLFYHTKMEHSYPHSWRSKKPLIFRATPQWFFQVDFHSLREDTLEAIDQVEWIPSWGITRIRSMVESRPDWCLSRQRNWGVPIPAFKCENCGQSLINKDTISFFTNRVKKEGIEIWYKEEASQLMPSDSKCESCSGTAFQKEKDILDVWFDSGVSNFVAIPERKEEPPADLYLEGSDQHRGWFQSSIWPSMALRGIPPYKSVMTHGYVLDEQGRAMSKSLGNGVDPTKDIVDVYGADILRLWVSSQDFRDDVKVGKESLKTIADQYRKVRNTFRYLLGNLEGHSEKDNLPLSELTEVDRYYLSRLDHLMETVQELYGSYQFHQIYQKLLLFCTVDLSQDYFEMIRDRMYCDARDSQTRKSSCTALYHILESLCLAVAPILSFTAEEVWKSWGKTDSVFFHNFPETIGFRDEALEKKFEPILKAKTAVQKGLEIARQAGHIGKSLEASVYVEPVGDGMSPITGFSQEEQELIYVVSEVAEKKPSSNFLSEFADEHFAVYVTKPDAGRCPRCWRHKPEVKTEKDLCHRCTGVV